MITILDYGMGNLRSVQKAFEFLGEKTCVSSTIAGADRLVIPGVGAFGAAMERISNLKSEIQHFAKSGQPLLGICLGQQLLFETSEEHGSHSGLEILPGRVTYLREPGLKVPHIGWAALHFRDSALANELKPESEVYFVHSLVTECTDPAHIAATASYGKDFAAAVRYQNIWGCQFHPEKSSSVGLQILKNWLTA